MCIFIRCPPRGNHFYPQRPPESRKSGYKKHVSSKFIFCQHSLNQFDVFFPFTQKATGFYKKFSHYPDALFSYIFCLQVFSLNQNSIAVVDFVLDDLGCPAGEGFQPYLKIRRFVAHLDFFVSFGFPGAAQ